MLEDVGITNTAVQTGLMGPFSTTSSQQELLKIKSSLLDFEDGSGIY